MKNSKTKNKKTQVQPSQQSGVESDKKQPQTQILLDLAKVADLFHTPDGEAFATLPVKSHRETWGVRSQGFKEWLTLKYYLMTKGAPSSQALHDAIATLKGRARFDAPEKPVFLRVASVEKSLYVDLGNEHWQVVKISADGWSVLDDSPVAFRRTKGTLPLPMPSQSPKVEVAKLLDFLNVESEDELKLIVGWLVAAFQQPGPFPVLVLHGEQGSAKSTTVKVIRDLLDPNTAPLRKEPRNSDDLLVSANSNWIVAVDNVSYLPDWLSDDFCRLATGGGLAKRQLYSDDDEFVLNVKRPIILNGIDEFVARGDLADRAILINLPSISKAGRKREETFWTEFNIVRPALFSLLLDAISHALATKNSFELDEKPRMADAWHWVSAAEPAFGWQRGSSLKALRENQFKVNEIILSSSPLYPFIRQLADEMWAGNAELLLTRLNNMQGTSHTMTSKNLPNNPRALSDKIRRLAPALRIAGIDVKMEKTSGSNSVRMIYFGKLSISCDASDASTPHQSEGDGRDDCVDKSVGLSNGNDKTPPF